MTHEPDVLVVGAGGDGPALSWRLGQLGLDVLILEAGPWHGNEQWPRPHERPGGRQSGDPDDLSGDLMDEQFTRLTNDTNNSNTGVLRFGPADRSRGPWESDTGGELTVNQVAGVGGTTLHYYANHPRATVPSVNDSGDWPIDYEELVPYYQLVEDTFAFGPGATTTKEVAFYKMAAGAGFDLLDGLNLTADVLEDGGYRPTPNLYAEPDPKLADEDYDGPFTYPEVEGDVLANDAYKGGPSPEGAPVREKARKSSNVTWVPAALDTGNVTIRPNTFVTDVRTSGGVVQGVDYRDTWSGQTGSIDAEVVVLAAGSIQTPRLWLNADLPANDWVGRGMTHHWFDAVHGIFDPGRLEALVGKRTLEPQKGQPWAARIELADGVLGLVGGNAPGVHATLLGTSAAGLAADNDASEKPWDTHGQLAGQQLKDAMSRYKQTMTMLISIDDEPQQTNGVSLSTEADENGEKAKLEWTPSKADYVKRETLAATAARIFRGAGAEWVHRSDMVPYLIHIHGTMAMGKAVDAACESFDVDGLFVGDHSVIPNAMGGQNPTHTGQSLAIRTAEKIHERHFATR
ncbi:MAG: GMC oxidoreductase [Haloarculaceae archaeon]